MNTSDLISSMKYCRDGPLEGHLAATLWDCSLLVLDTDQLDSPCCVARHSYKAPQLDSCWLNSHLYTGGFEQQVYRFNIDHEGVVQVGKNHLSPVSSVVADRTHGRVVSGSWDHSIQFIDPRESRSDSSLLQLPNKVSCMSVNGNYLVVAMADRLISIADLRMLDFNRTQNNVYQRNSSLKNFTRSICIDPLADTFVTGSIDGRVSVDVIDADSERSSAGSYAFKAHRHRDTSTHQTMAYPVNAICFHPHRPHCFFTGSSDGNIYLWDLTGKKRLQSLCQLQSSVICLDSWNNQLAIGSGDDSYIREMTSRPLPGRIFLEMLVHNP